MLLQSMVFTVKRFIKTLLLISLLVSPSVSASPELSKHQQLMASFLLQLTSFTQWPSSDNPQIDVCLLGDEPFKDYIDAMVKRRPRNRAGQPIVLNRIDLENMTLAHCNIIFSQPAVYEQMWQALPLTHHILLVGQGHEFIEQGGMINFAVNDKRIKLEVNLSAIEQAQLKLSSELLKHAKLVTGKPRSSYPKGQSDDER